MSALELQRTSADCGVAALRAALTFFGVKATYKTIYKLAETSRINGTPSQNVLKVLEHYNLSFEVRQFFNNRIAYKKLAEDARISILCFDELDHWVLKLCTVGDRTVIFDPEKGTLVLTKRQLLKRWCTDTGYTYAIGIESAQANENQAQQ